jgi:hypothetical protein
MGNSRNSYRPGWKHVVEPLEPRLFLCGTVPPPAGTAQASSVSDTWAVGVKQILYVSIKFKDQGNYPAVTNSMTWVADFIHETSYGQTTLVTTFKEVSLTSKASSNIANEGYADDKYDNLRADVLNSLRSTGVSVDSYDFDIMRYDGGPAGPLGGEGGGFAGVGRKGCWLRDDSAGTAAHELGHNLGLDHAGAWFPNDPMTVTGPGIPIAPGADTLAEYGNPTDMMGGKGGNPTDAKAK